MNYFEATFMQETETKKSTLDVFTLFRGESSSDACKSLIL